MPASTYKNRKNKRSKGPEVEVKHPIGEQQNPNKTQSFNSKFSDVRAPPCLTINTFRPPTSQNNTIFQIVQRTCFDSKKKMSDKKSFLTEPINLCAPKHT